MLHVFMGLCHRVSGCTTEEEGTVLLRNVEGLSAKNTISLPRGPESSPIPLLDTQFDTCQLCGHMQFAVNRAEIAVAEGQTTLPVAHM